MITDLRTISPLFFLSAYLPSGWEEAAAPLLLLGEEELRLGLPTAFTNLPRENKR